MTFFPVLISQFQFELLGVHRSFRHSQLTRNTLQIDESRKEPEEHRYSNEKKNNPEIAFGKRKDHQKGKGDNNQEEESKVDPGRLSRGLGDVALLCLQLGLGYTLTLLYGGEPLLGPGSKIWPYDGG